jgi:AAA15 family ATPase/GTPase
LYKIVTELLKDADLGIHGVEVKKITADDIELPKELSDEDRKRFLQYLKEEQPLHVAMLHRTVKTGKTIRLPLQEESDGTQRFFQLLGPWLETVALGFTVFIDELEVSLHPLLTRELIKFIQNPKINKSGAQLIFTTHDTTLLDPELLRRDQIWFTEKDKSGATNLYSMSDYKERRPRKGEAMQKGYLSGRYGAIPILEAFSLK